MNEADLIKLRESLPKVTENFWDLDEIIRSKSPRLAAVLPPFMKGYLKRVIHQEWLNDFVYSNRDHWGLDFIRQAMIRFELEPRVSGLENIPKTGRFLIAANHPLGGLDGIALMDVAGAVRPDVIFPVNDILMNIPNLYELFIPINKHGSNADNIKLFNKAFASDAPILYFPAGLVSRKQEGEVKDLEWKKTFLTKAKQYDRDIVPCFMGGKNSNFFYNLAKLRKQFKIQANIEMLYLVDEMIKLNDKHFPIIFGKPIPISTFDKRFNDREWSQKLKDHVYRLEKEPLATFEYLSNG